MKRRVSRLLVLVMFLAIFQPLFIQSKAYAADKTLTVVKDKFADRNSGYPEGDVDKYGNPYALFFGYLRAGDGTDFGAESAALQFDLSSIPAEKSIQSANLKIYIVQIDNTGATPYIDLSGSYDDSWPEDASPAMPSANKSIVTHDTNFPTTPNWKSFDVTDFVKSQLSDGQATFVLSGYQSAPANPIEFSPQVVFADKKNTAYAARLEITYVPNPPPTNLQLSSQSVAENSPIGTEIGTISSSDPGDTVTYSISSGGNGNFEIAGNTMQTTKVLNFEENSSYNITLVATDSAGNTLTKVFTIQVTNVNEAPTDALQIDSNALLTNSTNVTLSVSASDPDAGDALSMRFSNDNSTWSDWEPYTSTKDWSLLAGDGTKTVYLEVKDAAGLTASASDTIEMDATPPVVTGVSEGESYTTDQTITFNEGTATLNGSPFTSDTKVSTDGSYTLMVTDAAGNTTTVHFTIDKTPPTGAVSIEGGAAYTTKPDVNLQVSAGDAVKMRFSDDNSDWSGIAWVDVGSTKDFTKPWTLAGGDGTKTVYMQLQDAAGNIASFQDSIELDTVPPTGSLKINNDDAYTNKPLVNLQLTYGEAVKMRFSNDNSDWSGSNWEDAAATKPWTLTGGDGSKTVYMQLQDAAGNTSVTSLEDSIVLDTTTPVVTGVSDGDVLTSDQQIHFNEGTATLDGNPFDTGDTVVTEGSHVLAVTDAAGNTTTIHFTLDKNAPDGSLTINGGATYTNTLDAKLQISYGDAVKMRFSNENSDWSGIAWETVANAKDWKLAAGEGAKTVYMQLQDAAGNIATLQDSIGWDTDAPAGTLAINGGDAYTNTRNVTLQITYGQDAEKMAFSTDGTTWSDWEAVASTKDWTLENGDGSKTVYMKLKDFAGNTSVLQDSIEVDTAAPTGTLTINGGDAITNSTDVTLDITYGDAVKMRFSNDGSDWSGSSWEDAALQKSWKLSSGDGSKSVAMQLRDEAGNITTVTDSIELDSTAPVVTGVSDGGVYQDAVTITFLEGTAELNGSPFHSGDKVDSDGKYTLIVKDPAGNQTTIHFTVDKTPPTGALSINKGASSTYSVNVTLSVTADDALGGVEMRFSNDGTDWSSWEKAKATKSWTLEKGDGTKTVSMELRDEAGNTAAFTDTIELKTPVTPPPPADVPVTGVSLNQSSMTLHPDESETLAASVAPENATNKQVRWSSSDPEVAEVNGSGKVTAKAPGEAIITVTTVDGNKTDTCKVTVTEKASFHLEASKSSFWLKPKEKASFTIYAVDGKKRTDITKNADTSYRTEKDLVTVKPGRITAGNEEGEDLITVSYKGEEMTIPVTVSKLTVRSLTASIKQAVLELEEEREVSITAIFSDKSSKEVTEDAAWSSSNPGVVQVTETGTLKAGKPGTAVVTATYSGKKVSIRVLVVKEKAPKQLKVTPGTLKLKKQQTGTLVANALYEKGYLDEVTNDAEWTSADPQVATVEKGKVKAVAPGRTKITVSYGGKTATISVTVR